MLQESIFDDLNRGLILSVYILDIPEYLSNIGWALAPQVRGQIELFQIKCYGVNSSVLVCAMVVKMKRHNHHLEICASFDRTAGKTKCHST